MQRRYFLKRSTQLAVGASVLGLAACSEPSTRASAQTQPEKRPTAEVDKWFDISLAQWSLHKPIFAGELDNLEFARIARDEFGLGGIEYVSSFFKDKATDMGYLKQMNDRAAASGVKQLLIMVDGEGQLGAADDEARMQAVKNHHRWIDAAATLGCHSIRVNAAGSGSREEVAKAATEGLAKLSEYGKGAGINVIVENHGGYSSDGSWLANVIKNTGMDNCGTLPDFGNFCIERNPGGYEAGCKNEYDRYKGVEELMPYAKAVSAKAYDFDSAGEVTETNYGKMMGIVRAHDYAGWVGIEYEGSGEEPMVGIRKTVELLRKYGGRVG